MANRSGAIGRPFEANVGWPMVSVAQGIGSQRSAARRTGGIIDRHFFIDRITGCQEGRRSFLIRTTV